MRGNRKRKEKDEGNNLTEQFSILEPGNLSIDECYVVQKRRSTHFPAQNYRNVWLGHFFSQVNFFQRPLIVSQHTGCQNATRKQFVAGFFFPESKLAKNHSTRCYKNSYI